MSVNPAFLVGGMAVGQAQLVEPVRPTSYKLITTYGTRHRLAAHDLLREETWYREYSAPITSTRITNESFNEQLTRRDMISYDNKA